MNAEAKTPPVDIATKADYTIAIIRDIEECQKLLNAGAGKRGRAQVSSLLVQACEGTIKALSLVNVNFPKDLSRDLSNLVGHIVEVLLKLDTTSGSMKNPARVELLSLCKNLQSRLEADGESPYNPLNLSELTRSIESAFSRNPPLRLPDIKPFRGSGVYALYYTGDFSLYRPIAESNRRTAGSWAIYVGKAGRESKRKGIKFDGTNSGRSAIYERLANQHTESIKQAKNLRIEDFWVRYLPIEGLFVPLCEGMLIAQHQPLWNNVVDGFGNKHMGVARIDFEKGQQITAWDLLHPGRTNRAVKPNKRFPTVSVLEEAVRQALDKAEHDRPALSTAIKNALEGTQEQADG